MLKCQQLLDLINIVSVSEATFVVVVVVLVHTNI